MARRLSIRLAHSSGETEPRFTSVLNPGDAGAQSSPGEQYHSDSRNRVKAALKHLSPPFDRVGGVPGSWNLAQRAIFRERFGRSRRIFPRRIGRNLDG